METTTTTSQIAVKYGVLLGLTSIVANVIFYVLGMHLERSAITTSVGLLLVIGFVVYGIAQFKKENNFTLSLSQALKTGVGISLIAGIIGGIYLLIFAYFIEPNFTQQILEKQQEQMILQNPNMTEEQLDMAINMTKKFVTPGMLFIMGLVWSIFLGFIVSLIAGLVMKKEA